MNKKFSVDPRLKEKELRMNPVLQKKVDDSGWGLPGLKSLPVSSFASRENIGVLDLDEKGESVVGEDSLVARSIMGSEETSNVHRVTVN